MDCKYLNIYNEIVNKIENRELKSNAKLPSENEFMRMYNVSRDTIRKSLNLLEQNGYIQKIKGKGSFVLDIDRLDFPVSGLVSFKELCKKMNMETKTIVKEMELIEPNGYLMEQMEISQNDDVWKVVRVREIDGKRIILDKDFFDKRFVPLLTKDICEDSIYEYIENKLGLKISYARKEIIIQQATGEDKKYLDLENFNMVVVVKTYTYLEDTSLFQYGESRHRPDKFKFVDFARRKHQL